MANTDKFQMKTARFKRGLRSVLEARLVDGDLGVLLAGEPAFETDTGQLKIGNGVSAYIDLPYVGKSAEGVRFAITDPVDNQILLYDSASQKWINRDLADKESIIYLAEHGLTIKGYEKAKQGYMLVKDQTAGLAWVEPVNLNKLNETLAIAESYAATAGSYATSAGNSASEAALSVSTAGRINQTTMKWVNDKFWWGTVSEYNAEIAENGLNPGTFYFVKPD